MNVEIKARCDNQALIQQYLKRHDADFHGLDHQIDTYFIVPKGRLKLRQGNIENALIYYERENQAGPKQSLTTKSDLGPDSDIKDVLTKVFEVLTVVDKQREIYFIDNVKFHIDRVERLGTFVEIEAIDKTGRRGHAELLSQCQKYLKDFGIKEDALVPKSYSDLLLES